MLLYICNCFAVSVDQKIADLRGPGFMSRWVYWTTLTSEQKKRAATMDEIMHILASQSVSCVFFNWSLSCGEALTLYFSLQLLQRPEQVMSDEDVTTVRRNLSSKKIVVSNKFVSIFT